MVAAVQDGVPGEEWLYRRVARDQHVAAAEARDDGITSEYGRGISL